MDNAGKDGGRVQLHQDGQEDVRKAQFHGQFVPIWPISAVFSAGLTCGQDDPPCPHKLQLQTLMTGAKGQEHGNT